MRERLFVKLSTIVMRIISKSFEVSARKVTQKFDVSLTFKFRSPNNLTSSLRIVFVMNVKLLAFLLSASFTFHFKRLNY